MTSATSRTAAGTLSIRPVEPVDDGDLLFGWVTQERAEFWGMRYKDRDEVVAIYSYIDEQPHLTASLVHLDGVPVALFQTYDPYRDEIGEYYERRPGDLGVHLFLADEPARAGRTTQVMSFVIAFLGSDPLVRRLVVEPDVRNAKSVALLRRLGFRFGPTAELPGKTARFGFLGL